ncbi:thiolase family protein [Bdellovibrio bacteriovorus]|uniref:Acetyl-CoA acyltransferase n=1 Tax=Bdellovibrio bacteriovorus (strain ATCC 15356 / DSM 50701 / NCIMB 9529 / HD100) TaxID=264462 RepID=Q6MM13_BDEBA|nr:thiolase family protein [Bdellovibrio bacteriovorus]AHZ84346.1 acetyl-CoA acyltransferase [Bdellovibrio bacteriovorus]BEV68234.1 Acetyl-CoA acetyltransferase [Bdellovibrio bacteriovorus]CAE79693.1 acetyl-CoA acyltransferase [Bdellovibrio bacteriovorus HD100]
MKSPRDVVLVEGVRTPFAKAGTKLKKVHPAELGKVALKQVIAQTNLDVNLVDEVIIGNTGNPPDSVNISRVVALNAGIPLKTSAYTVHRNCASALESISNGYEKIKSGTMDVILAGGTENMSQMPTLPPKKFQEIYEKLFAAKGPKQALPLLWSLFKADVKQIKALLSGNMRDEYFPVISVMMGLTDPFVGINMGQTAEILAKEWGLSRETQDKFALRSHQLASKAMKEGRMREEIAPVYLAPEYKEVISEDIGPRDTQTMEALAKLKPFFDKATGSITAGNSCPITDGAAMVLMMSREKAEALGYKPLATIRSYGFAGLEPERMGLGPVYSTPVALKRAGLSMKDIGLVELNEAFAAQVLSCQKAFDSDKFGQEKLGLSSKIGEIRDDILNVNGGAIALGHPVGATGTRIVLTLAKEMKRRNTQFGLATLCIGGGQGGSMILENEG